MRLTYITAALAAGAASIAVAVAPTAAADPLPAQPVVIATAQTAVAGHLNQVRFGGWDHHGDWGGDHHGGWGGGWGTGSA
jgi:opacity protein-like surface antigen